MERTERTIENVLELAMVIHANHTNHNAKCYPVCMVTTGYYYATAVSMLCGIDNPLAFIDNFKTETQFNERR